MTNHVRTDQVAHYVISHTAPSDLGATKLNKVMWQADILHYRRYGETITGQKSYVRWDRGPMPNGIYPTLKRLEDEGHIVTRRTLTPVGHRTEYASLERPNPQWFTSQEIETIHEAIKLICPLSAAVASERTHGLLWDELKNGDQMPISAASIVPGEILPEDIEWALQNRDAFVD